MADKNGALDLTILAQVDGIEEVQAAVANAISALRGVEKALENVSVTMDVE
ncbi:hypothetical protein SEA_MUSETTA_11 [Microbacterium phage Musetta]|nr:hypothetical protein SEA_FORK_8 [Microbacterium phage Fork]QCS26958.1 hypothetical protein SEA_MUSETTA_11 [Microbacterium phage Musetta]UVK62429.1 hypothetical protein SEA_YUMA_11 [Microbacterium phage Yuma]WMI33883.1 hypothetical protein SEA_ERENYEAGER_8 [Microbacterium phage Erenyeager]